VPSRGHRGERGPAVGFEVVGFELGIGFLVAAFAASNEDLVLIEYAGDAAARGWQRWAGLPGVGRRIVDVVKIRVLR